MRKFCTFRYFWPVGGRGIPAATRTYNRTPFNTLPVRRRGPLQPVRLTAVKAADQIGTMRSAISSVERR
jgi:hypothetical protein